MATKITDFAAPSKLWQALGPLSVNEPVVSSDSIDMLEADGPAFAILVVKPESEDATVSGILEASSDESTWEEIAGAEFDEAAGSGVRAITFQRPARYVRAVLAVDGDEEDVVLGVIFGESKKLF